MTIMMEAKELKEQLNNENLMIIDVRTKYDAYDSGEAAYEASHIPGAVFLDMKKDVTGEKQFLPEPHRLAEKLGSLGISEKDDIVLYDQGNKRASSKAWVALHHLGHDRIFILHGGYPAWESKNYEQSTELRVKEPTTYQVNLRKSSVMTLTEVKQQLQEETLTLIDSRSYERYCGKVEPTYKKAGHIPGAINYESKEIFDARGNLKSEAALQAHFQDIHPDEKVVVSCGSGGSACMNMVALVEAGYKDVALFAGGFSEWIENDSNDIATEDQ